MWLIRPERRLSVQPSNELTQTDGLLQQDEPQQQRFKNKSLLRRCSESILFALYDSRHPQQVLEGILRREAFILPDQVVRILQIFPRFPSDTEQNHTPEVTHQAVVEFIKINTSVQQRLDETKHLGRILLLEDPGKIHIEFVVHSSKHAFQRLGDYHTVPERQHLIEETQRVSQTSIDPARY